MNRNIKTDFYRYQSSFLIFLIALVFCGSMAAQNKSTRGGGAVCGDAARSECTKDDSVFKPYSLVFKLGPKAAKDPQQYAEGETSEFFYAVLIETVNGYKPSGGCRELSETKRLAVQEMFPHNKAFTYNYYCVNPGEGDQFTGYEFPGATEQTHLLAVYGGAAQADAAKILALAKKKYPKARIVKMRAIVVEQHDV